MTLTLDAPIACSRLAADFVGCDSTESWLRVKDSGIGASEAPALWDAIPGCRQRLRLLKLRLVDPIEQTPLMELGTRMEPMLTEYLVDELQSGERAWRPTLGTFRSRKSPHLLATPDAIVFDGNGDPVATAELKFTKILREYDATEDKWPRISWDRGERPFRWIVQLQHQMAVLGVDLGFLVVCIGVEGRVVVDRIARDDRFLERHLNKCSALWRDVEAARLAA